MSHRRGEGQRRSRAPDKKLLVLTTGGTIDKIYFDAKSEFEVGKSMVGELLRQAHVDVDVSVREVLRKDSLDMDDADRALVRSAVETASETRIVITHGTDTMADTARSLVGIPRKTIVLTGALAPARFAVTDATFNVGMAFAAVQTLAPGVYVVMNGRVFDGTKVKKDRQANRFIDE
jgi:L-asparaginase